MFDFIEVLRGELPRFKKVLELGSKDGKDLKLLHEYYEVVASEDTKLKTRALKDEFIDIRVILLEPISMDTHKKFDCIFSRNLYDDLDETKIEVSFENQKKVLEKDGIIFHIFDENKRDLSKYISSDFELLKSENNYFIAKLKS